jgi:arabinogalactan oligomer/maltooligosaccharide transport system substrate-binding protein
MALTIWTEQASVSAVKSLSANWAKERGIIVEVVGKNGFGLGGDLATIGPAGKGPDIIILGHDSIAGLAISGAISPLFSSIFDPKSVAKSAVTAVSFKSQIYAIPLTVQNLALATNLTLAKSAPSTFSEMEEKSRALIAAGKTKVGLVTDANGYGVYPIFDALGGYVFKTSSMGKIDPKVTGIYSSELAKNTAVFERFKREKFMDFSKLWGNTAFFDGKAPYMLVGAWNVPALSTSPFKYEISGIPNLQGRPARVLTGVQAAAMSNFAKNKLVARDYMKNVVSKSDFSSALAKAQNSFPVNLVAAAAQDPNSIGTKFGNVGMSGFPMPNIPQMQKVWSYWNGAWENWGNDKGSFSEIFSKAAKDLTLALNS